MYINDEFCRGISVIIKIRIILLIDFDKIRSIDKLRLCHWNVVEFMHFHYGSFWRVF